jgi:uncharacterized protein YdgA (DUF945 family)
MKEGLMKKVFSVVIALFFLAAALFCGATFWFGMQAEQHYHDALQQASQSVYMHLANESYDRGFFRSKARTVVKIRDFSGKLTSVRKEPEEFLGFTLVHDIRHGPLQLGESPEGKRELKPVLAIIETWIEPSPETQAKVKEIFTELPEIASMKNYTTLSLAGDGETRLFIPPCNRTVGKDEKVAVYWKGLTANMAFNADLKGFTGSLSAPGLEAVGDDAELGINGLASTFDTHEGISGLFLGDASFDLAHLEFAEKKNGQRKQFSMDGLKIQTSSQALTDTVNYSMTVQIDRVMTDDRPYGPGGCELELRKLDAATLARLQQVFQELQAQFPQRSVEEINKMMLAKYSEILPELVKKSPEIEITKLTLKTTDGDFWGRARIVFDGINAAAMSNPLFLLSAVTAHAELTITDRLLQRIHESSHKKEIVAAIKQGRREPVTDEELHALASAECKKRLETLVAQNILIYDDGQYKASADYQQGRVILNGRPLTLQDLMQRR